MSHAPTILIWLRNLAKWRKSQWHDNFNCCLNISDCAFHESGDYAFFTCEVDGSYYHVMVQKTGMSVAREAEEIANERS